MTVWWAGIGRSRGWHFSHRDQAPESIKHLRIVINQGSQPIKGYSNGWSNSTTDPAKTSQTGALCVKIRLRYSDTFWYTTIRGYTQMEYLFLYASGLHSTSFSIYCTNQGGTQEWAKYLYLLVWGGRILPKWECYTGYAISHIIIMRALDNNTFYNKFWS